MLIGTVAGVYVGMVYGMERICGTKDWVILNSHFCDWKEELNLSPPFLYEYKLDPLAPSKTMPRQRETRIILVTQCRFAPLRYVMNA